MTGPATTGVRLGRATGPVPATREPAPESALPPHAMQPLTRDEALALLAGAGFGRIVFSHHALPAIRPVNHILDGGSIVVRTHEGAALNALVRGAGDEGVVVAYEADEIDPVTRTGWSVIATGYATAVTDPAELDRYRVLLRPWVGGRRDHAIRVRPVEVTAYRLVAPPAEGPATPAT